MKKSILVFLAIIVVLVSFAILKSKPENKPITVSNSLQSLPIANLGSSAIIAEASKKSQTQNIDDSEQKSISDIVALVAKELPANNPKNKPALNAVDDYLINTFAAMNSTTKDNIIANYKNTYLAMSCAMYYMQQTNQDGYLMFNKINAIMSQNRKITSKRAAAEGQISGTIFSDITKNEKKVVCNEKYNQ